MKIKLLLLAIALPVLVVAQKPKKKSKFGALMKAAQETGAKQDAATKKTEASGATSSLQSSDNYGKKFPGWYISSSGDKRDGLIVFDAIGDMTNNDNPLKFTLDTDENFESIKKSDLKAFFVNSRLYTAVDIEGKRDWVINISQGAIAEVAVVRYIEPTDRAVYDTVPDPGSTLGYKIVGTLVDVEGRWDEVQKVQKFGKVSPAPFGRKDMVALVAEYEDLATKIENKEKGYKSTITSVGYNATMFGYYNKWYDENNPGAITYYPTVATFVAPKTTNSYQTEVLNAAEEAHRAPRIDVFAGRPATASAAVASAKPEVAVKKQSFKDRLARIKADGNKVGVLVTSQNLVINPGTGTSEGITKAQVMGTYGPLEGIDKIAKTTADELNAGFGTDVFEAVDYSQIPVKEGKYGKIDDWWSTKYKVIFIYELEPSYSAIYKVVNSETLEREYQAKMHVHGDIIVMSAEEIKPEKLKYVTSSPKTWGYYNTDKFIGPAETDFHTIQQLKAAINPPSDEVVVDAIIESQKEGLAKFVKKKSK